MSDNSKNKMGLTTQMITALVAGLTFGAILNFINGIAGESIRLFINQYIVTGILGIVGKIFINGIKMLVVPLVLVSLICGVAAIGDIKKLGRVGGKTVTFYLLTTATAIALALIISNIIDPGSGLKLASDTTEFSYKKAPSLSEVIVNIVPVNPFRAVTDGKMLQVIFFAMLTGIAIATLGKKVETVLKIFEELNEIVMKMITLIMKAAPAGVFCLIAKVFAEQGFSAFLPLLKYMITVLIVLLVHLLFVYSGTLKIIGKLSPVMFFKKFYPTMLIAFSTSSSNATIPVTMNTAEKKWGFQDQSLRFLFPLVQQSIWMALQSCRELP